MEPSVKNPYHRGVVTVAGLVGFSLLATLGIWGISIAGYASPGLIWIGLALFLFFAFIWIIIWILGAGKARHAKTFLNSERALLRWTYSSAEWQQLKESLWQEEKGDWKIQWACMTVLLALAGLLTGMMLGLEDNFLAVIVNGFIGLVLGGLAGTALGILIAGGNYLGAKQSYQRAEPGQVALGMNEIYASDDYFKGDGRSSYIREATIHPGNPTTLELVLVFPPRPRMPLEEQWIVPIPPKSVKRVEEILPRLTNRQKHLPIE